MGIISAIAITPLGIRGSLILSGVLLIIFFFIGIIFLKKKQLENMVENRRSALVSDN